MRRLEPRAVSSALVHVLFITMTLLLLFPLYWMMSSSLKDKSEIFVKPPVWIPQVLQWNNFTELFTSYGYGRILWNSIFAAGMYTLGALTFLTMAGFAFAKYTFRGKNILFLFVLASLMIPIETSVIPLYMMYREIGLVNNLWGVILPGMAKAFGVFFMRQYCADFHDEILEAGRIDGCSELGMFARLVVPNLKPAFASLGIIFFVEQWNNFFWPSIVLRSMDQMTISVAIKALDSGVRTPYHLVMSASTLSVLPLIAVVLIFQKPFISGLMDGAVKG